jgi:ribosomal protein S12 methylthiotransferase accessory factor
LRQTERLKAYKATDPLNTINRIRNILSSIDIFTIESHRVYEVPEISCCRVLIGDNDLVNLDFGSNGKGLTSRYALASAYGEFIERLQNNSLFKAIEHNIQFATKRYLETEPSMTGFRERLEREDLLLDFVNGPDEVYLETDSLMESCSDVLSEIFLTDDKEWEKNNLHKILTGSGQDDFCCVPFYSVLQNQVRLLPINLISSICGTNGMCAGNTPEEALIQGISEIFERFAMRSIYQQKITPPTIPDEYFQNTTILDRIQRLEKAGFTATIKDCSLGLGLPVIGLLLSRQTTEKNTLTEEYTFHVGADPCPITALERCLTEIYQGTQKDIESKFNIKRFTNTTTEEYNHEEGSNLSWLDAYYDTLIDGTGHWPESIFSDSATYPFAGFSHPVSISDTADLAYLVTKVKDLGRNIFIRDVSFLGFPSYQIYIPGMTETYFIEKTERLSHIGSGNKLTLLNLGHADPERISQLVKDIRRTVRFSKHLTFEPKFFFLSNVHPLLQKMSRDYLLTLLYIRISDYQAAAESMASFLQSEIAQSEYVQYYKALYSYLKAKSAGLSDAQIKAMLTDLYDEIVVRDILERFEIPERIFEQQMIFPSCFDCDTCGIGSFCRYFALIRKVRTIQKIQQVNAPDQAKLAKIFYNINTEVSQNQS